jgi:hypothetical protein
MTLATLSGKEGSGTFLEDDKLICGPYQSLLSFLPLTTGQPDKNETGDIKGEVRIDNKSAMDEETCNQETSQLGLGCGTECRMNAEAEGRNDGREWPGRDRQTGWFNPKREAGAERVG